MNAQVAAKERARRLRDAMRIECPQCRAAVLRHINAEAKP